MFIFNSSVKTYCRKGLPIRFKPTEISFISNEYPPYPSGLV